MQAKDIHEVSAASINLTEIHRVSSPICASCRWGSSSPVCNVVVEGGEGNSCCESCQWERCKGEGARDDVGIRS